MIRPLPSDQLEHIAHLVKTIPDATGDNLTVLSYFGAGLLPVCRLYAYYSDGVSEPTGYVLYELGGHVQQLAVDKYHRRQGIGRKLLDHAMARQTCDHQTLYVRGDNSNAIDFYKHIGFKPTGETEVVRGYEFLTLARNKTCHLAENTQSG